MDSSRQPGVGRKNDFEAIDKVQERDKIDGVIDFQQNLNEKHRLSPLRTSYARILRSGTTLGQNAEVRRLRNVSVSRKQGVKAKVLKALTSDEGGGISLSKTMTSMDKHVGDLTKGVKSPKHQHNVSGNIDDLYYSKTDSTTERKIVKDSDSAAGNTEKNDSRLELDGKTVSNIKVSSQGVIAADKRGKPKSRLENCTVSLLEQQGALNNQTLATKEKIDFKRGRDIPEEVFIVSLSKDENKELSVLSTSNGTLHVRSGGIHKRHLAELTYTGKGRENAADKICSSEYSDYDSALGISYGNKENGKGTWKKDTAKRSKTVPFGNAFVDVNKGSVSEVNTQTPKAESNISKNSDSGGVMSRATTKVTHSLISKETTTNAGNPLSNVAARQDSFNAHKCVKSEPGNLQTKGHTSNTFESEKPWGYFMAKGYTSSCEKLDKSAKVELKPLSQFPLMERILTREGHASSDDYERNSSSKTSKPLTLITNHTEGDLPGLTKPSSIAKKTCQINDENIPQVKQCPKRSERIRSKSMPTDNDIKSSKLKLDHSSQNPEQTQIATANEYGECISDLLKAIPTQKYSHHRSTSSSSLAISPVENLQTSTTSSKLVGTNSKKETSCAPKKKLKKKKKRKSLEGVEKVEKKAKDFSKGKACMSQEVMDAIVKSIEETVSRVRRESEEKEEKIGLLKNGRDRGSSLKLANNNDAEILQSDSDNSLQSDYICIGDDRDQLTVIPGDLSNKSSKTMKMSAAARQKVNQNYTKHLRHSNSIGGASADLTTVQEATFEPGDKSSNKRGKRCRRKTRKAEEALGTQDIFWDYDWPAKKANTKKRPIANAQVSKDASGQRRSRRGLEKEEKMSDPVLEEHAFMLWASEHRSEIEQKLPNVSVSEMDALLSDRWCDVATNVKARFFARARDAFSDDDRQLIKAKHLGYKDVTSDAMCGFILDRDPNFHDFILLPINRQRDFLRKWLKFFQKMLPRREYVDFIITFKRACGREDSSTFMGKSKRMRMRCLDPAHYQTLFDLIRLSKPRVLEAYRERRGMEKKMVSNTYSHMLKTLINGDPWPHMIRSCRSKPLTELLYDLRHLHDQDTGDGHYDSSKLSEKGFISQMINDKKPISQDGIEFCQDFGALEVTVSLTEQDYSVLDTDLALGLMSDLNKLDDLPVLDQSLLEEVLQPACQTTPLSLLQAQGNDVNCMYNTGNILSSHASNVPRCRMGPLSSPFTCQPIANAANCAMTSCTGHLCPPSMTLSDSIAYPKINIHYRSSLPSSNRLMHCPYPRSHSTALVSYRMCHTDQSSGFINSKNKFRSCAFVGNPYDSGAFGSKSAYERLRENIIHEQGDSVTGRCIKVHQRHSQSPVRMSARPYQVPISSLAPHSKFHPKSVTMPYGSQQKLVSEMNYRQGMIMMNSSSLSKLDQAYLHHNPSGCRINCPSPLITSLTPFRAIKSNAQRSKGQHCQVLPHKSKIHCASSGYHSDNQTFWKTATAHAIPISTSLRPCGAVTSPRPQGNMSQIKVCLPTQALKIPIAKLRGARKTAFVKGRMKSIHLSQATLTHRSDTTVGCQSSHSLVNRQNNQSVLAKVLSFQSGSENDVFNAGILTASSTAPPLHRSSLYPPLMTVSRRNPAMQITSNAYINSGCSSSSSNDRPDSHAHLVSVMNPNPNTVSLTSSKMLGSGQTAVIINPLHLQRRPLLPSKCSIDRSTTGHHLFQEFPEGSSSIQKDVSLVNHHGTNDFNVNRSGGGHGDQKPRSDTMPDIDIIQMCENDIGKTETLDDEHCEEGQNEELPILELMAGTNEGNDAHENEQHSNRMDGIGTLPFNKAGSFNSSADSEQRPSDGDLLGVSMTDVNPHSLTDSGSARNILSFQSLPTKDFSEKNQDHNNQEKESIVNASETDHSPLKTTRESEILRDPGHIETVSGSNRNKNGHCDAENRSIHCVAQNTKDDKNLINFKDNSSSKHLHVVGHTVYQEVATSATEDQCFGKSAKFEDSTFTSMDKSARLIPEGSPLCTPRTDDPIVSTVDEISATVNVTYKITSGGSESWLTSPPAKAGLQNDQLHSATAGSVNGFRTDHYAPNDRGGVSENSPTKRDGNIADVIISSREVSSDGVQTTVSEPSPVKRSYGVVRQSSVFSQITEIVTPVTASSSCRVPTCSSEIDKAHKEESLERQRQRPSRNVSPDIFPVKSGGTENRNSTSAIVDVTRPLSSLETDARKTVEVKASSDLRQRANLMVLECATVTQVTTTYNTSQSLSQTVTTYCLDNVPLVSTSPSSMAAATSIFHDSKGNLSSVLQTAPVSDGDNRKKSNIGTLIKRTIPSTKPLTSTTIQGPVTNSGDTISSSPSRCRKRARYVHEYLPT